MPPTRVSTKSKATRLTKAFPCQRSRVRPPGSRAARIASGTEYEMRATLTQRAVRNGRRVRSQLIGTKSGVQGITKAVAQQVEPQDRKHDGGTGEEEYPPGAGREVLVRVGEHRAPLGCWGLSAEPEEA